MVQAESSKDGARNGVRANPNNFGANYELPWCVKPANPFLALRSNND